MAQSVTTGPGGKTKQVVMSRPSMRPARPGVMRVRMNPRGR